MEKEANIAADGATINAILDQSDSDLEQSRTQVSYQRNDRALLRAACIHQGKLWKRTSGPLPVYQLRFFRFIANGQYLCYYDYSKFKSRSNIGPKGVFSVVEL